MSVLSKSDNAYFFSIWFNLLWRINEEHGVIPAYKKPNLDSNTAVNSANIIEIREAVWDSPQWIDDDLASEAGKRLPYSDREIIASWRKYFKKSDYFLIAHCPKYTVLAHHGLHDGTDCKMYGVLGLTDPIYEAFPFPPPFLFKTTLLPFKGKIVYDGIGIITPAPTDQQLFDLHKILLSFLDEFDIITTLIPANTAGLGLANKKPKLKRRFLRK
jgi:hypothetical protein